MRDTPTLDFVVGCAYAVRFCALGIVESHELYWIGFGAALVCCAITLPPAVKKVRQRKAQIREEKLRAKRMEMYEAALRIINSKTAKMCDVCPLSYDCKGDCGGICPIRERLKDAAAEEIEKGIHGGEE